MPAYLTPDICPVCNTALCYAITQAVTRTRPSNPISAFADCLLGKEPVSTGGKHFHTTQPAHRDCSPDKSFAHAAGEHSTGGVAAYLTANVTRRESLTILRSELAISLSLSSPSPRPPSSSPLAMSRVCAPAVNNRSLVPPLILFEGSSEVTEAMTLCLKTQPPPTDPVGFVAELLHKMAKQTA